MSMQSLSTWSLATNKAHWQSPFTHGMQNADFKYSVELSLAQKIASVAIAVLAGIPTLGLGGVAAFYLTTAFFKARKIKQLNGVDTISACSLSSKLPPPPANGIKMGLINVGQSCWFNSILKFFSASTNHDYLFDINVDDLELNKEEKALRKEVQTQLRNMIRTIRLAPAGTVVDRTQYMDLLKILDRVFPTRDVLTDPQNVATIIDNIRCLFIPIDQNGREELKAWHPQSTMYDVNAATAEYQISKKLHRTSIGITQRADAPPLANPLNLAKHYGRVIDNRCSLHTHLPHELIFETTQLWGENSPLNIEYGPNLTLELLEYDPNTAKPAAHCVYQAQGVIPKYSNHIRFCERAKNGTYILHDDSRVKRIAEKEAIGYFRDPSLVSLRLLSKTPIK